MWRDGERGDGIVGHLRRARVVKVDDSGTQQKVNLRGAASDRPEEVVRVLPHGFASNPPADAEGVLLSLGGRSDRLVFLGGEHKDKRIKDLPSGAAVLYDDKGNVVFARSSDGIAVRVKEGKIVVDPSDANTNVYLGGDPDKGHQ